MYTTTVGLTFEFMLTAFKRTFRFVTPVTAIVGAIADRHTGRTVIVRALEHTRSTHSLWTTGRFVRTIFTVLLTVASIL